MTTTCADLGDRRLVRYWFHQDLTPSAKTIGDMVDGLEEAVDELRTMRELGVVLSEDSEMEEGLAILVTKEPSVANRFGFELEREGDDEESPGQSLPNFDEYVNKPVFIPIFIWDDGELRPFQGSCRGNGPIFAMEEWEDTIGVFTEAGKYFAVLIDTRIHCAVPQFWIDGKPFDFPIVSFSAMGAWVDPATGILKTPPMMDPGQAARQRTSTDEVDSTKAPAGKQADKSTATDDRQ